MVIPSTEILEFSFSDTVPYWADILLREERVRGYEDSFNLPERKTTENMQNTVHILCVETNEYYNFTVYILSCSQL